MISEKIEEFAKEYGFDGAEFKCKWSGYNCYEPVFSNGIAYLGLPQFIFESENGNIRMSTSEEAFQLIDELTD